MRDPEGSVAAVTRTATGSLAPAAGTSAATAALASSPSSASPGMAMPSDARRRMRRRRAPRREKGVMARSIYTARRKEKGGLHFHEAHLPVATALLLLPAYGHDTFAMTRPALKAPSGSLAAANADE